MEHSFQLLGCAFFFFLIQEAILRKSAASNNTRETAENHILRPRPRTSELQSQEPRHLCFHKLSEWSRAVGKNLSLISTIIFMNEIHTQI